MSLDRPILIGTPPAKPGKVEVCRSFSYKLNLGPYGRQYEAADFFASRKMECDASAAEWVSQQIYEECVAEVQASVGQFIVDLKKKQKGRAEVA